jgi:KaiC/GvpD/RAD55 family RecA-like ATPase
MGEMVGKKIQDAENPVAERKTGDNGSNLWTTPYSQAVLSANKLTALEIPERRKIVNPYLSESAMVMIVGPPGIGKTLFTLYLSCRVCKGEKFGPWETNQTSILYLDLEMHIQELQARIKQISGDNPPSNLFLYSEHLAHQCGLDKGKLDSESFQQAILTLCRMHEIGLVIVDNLSAGLPGKDENVKKEWDSTNQFFLSLRFEEIAVIFLHHTGKGGDQRGTSSRLDALDFAIRLDPLRERTKGEAGFVLRFGKNRTLVDDRALIADREFRFLPEGGFIHSVAKADFKGEMLRALYADEKLSLELLAGMIGIKKPYACKLRGKLISEGLLDKDYHVTEAGKKALGV